MQGSLFFLCSYPHPWLSNAGIVWKNQIADISDWSEWINVAALTMPFLIFLFTHYTVKSCPLNQVRPLCYFIGSVSRCLAALWLADDDTWVMIDTIQSLSGPPGWLPMEVVGLTQRKSRTHLLVMFMMGCTSWAATPCSVPCPTPGPWPGLPFLSVKLPCLKRLFFKDTSFLNSLY